MVELSTLPVRFFFMEKITPPPARKTMIPATFYQHQVAVSKHYKPISKIIL
ncbi:hypothetical protein [Chitinophaga nivalis]|uniref:Uncharacterized protein n=1 Tax=Chitinophaga nivalis TaxID=2991709 RepID=A0ABT3IMR4_9BACT|nr:hypothetical protein [Chitinophaga nivalis]MCW3465059.1 hypothetical protein [Chitinophaga nivalis]MCW3485249.1 hypothetical protein [Chitinophaga nivalis]